MTSVGDDLMRPPEGSPGQDRYPLWRAVAWAALLVFVDAIWLGQGIISFGNVPLSG